MRLIKKITVVLLTVLLVVGFSFSDIFAKSLYKNINNEQLEELIKDDKTLLVDVRYPREWQWTGIVPTSKLLTTFAADRKQTLQVDLIKDKFKLIAKDTPIIIICAHGYRSKSVSNLLAGELGYTNVYNVTNGITAWISAKKPITKSRITDLL